MIWLKCWSSSVFGLFPWSWASEVFFQEGAKSGEICFFALKTKKTTFYSKYFKIQGSLAPLAPIRRPSWFSKICSCPDCFYEWICKIWLPCGCETMIDCLISSDFVVIGSDWISCFRMSQKCFSGIHIEKFPGSFITTFVVLEPFHGGLTKMGYRPDDWWIPRQESLPLLVATDFL